jgi:hypothetical protein
VEPHGSLLPEDPTLPAPKAAVKKIHIFATLVSGLATVVRNMLNIVLQDKLLEQTIFNVVTGGVYLLLLGT